MQLSTHLGANEYFFPRQLLQPTPEQFLRVTGTVEGSTVEEIDSVLEGLLDGCHGFGLIRRLKHTIMGVRSVFTYVIRSPKVQTSMLKT